MTWEINQAKEAKKVRVKVTVRLVEDNTDKTREDRTGQDMT